MSNNFDLVFDHQFAFLLWDIDIYNWKPNCKLARFTPTWWASKYLPSFLLRLMSFEFTFWPVLTSRLPGNVNQSLIWEFQLHKFISISLWGWVEIKDPMFNFDGYMLVLYCYFKNIKPILWDIPIPFKIGGYLERLSK